MALSRPALLALLGAILVAALFYATSGREATDKPSPPAAPAKHSSRAKTVPKARSSAKARAHATARRSPAAKAKAAAALTGVPADVTKALEQKRTVVLFFFQRGSADDDATARSVASLKGRSGVDVFSAPISRLADYRGVTAGAGVSQAPAVVILGRNGGARLIEGFVDRETLAQEVADSR